MVVGWVGVMVDLLWSREFRVYINVLLFSLILLSHTQYNDMRHPKVVIISGVLKVKNTSSYVGARRY